MAYTVQETADLSGVTIKTLYHYQKIGLLLPQMIGANGYRYYGEDELERLQQILFFRELDFSLEQIKAALENEPNRLKCLDDQKTLLIARRQRLENILDTINETISHARKGIPMNTEKLFKGLNQQEWQNALAEQNTYLQKQYDFTLDVDNVDAEKLNTQAAEAVVFMSFMSSALKNGVSAGDAEVMDAIEKHISFLNQTMPLDAQGFAAQCRFFLADDFHRGMMEAQQIGLSYFVCIAAESYAKK